VHGPNLEACEDGGGCGSGWRRAARSLYLSRPPKHFSGQPFAIRDGGSSFLLSEPPALDGGKAELRKEARMSEERQQHPQEPAEGAEEDVGAPGADRADDESAPGTAGGDTGPSRHSQQPAEGADEDVDAPGAERAGDGT
jgi:hypothetical protein